MSDNKNIFSIPSTHPRVQDVKNLPVISYDAVLPKIDLYDFYLIYQDPNRNNGASYRLPVSSLLLLTLMNVEPSPGVEIIDPSSNPDKREFYLRKLYAGESVKITTDKISTDGGSFIRIDWVCPDYLKPIVPLKSTENNDVKILKDISSEYPHVLRGLIGGKDISVRYSESTDVIENLDNIIIDVNKQLPTNAVAVSKNGSPHNSGRSWDSTWTLEYAIDFLLSNSASNYYEIWVKNDEYLFSDIFAFTSKKYFEIIKPLKIIGGFIGNEYNINELSDKNYSAFNGECHNSKMFDVVTSEMLPSTQFSIVFQNIIFKNELFDALLSTGGIISTKDNAKFLNCIFENLKVVNGNAGAIYAGDSCEITNCKFIDNQSDKNGGAVFIKSNFPSNFCKIENSEFNSNVCNKSGAAIYCESSLILTDSKLISNRILKNSHLESNGVCTVNNVLLVFRTLISNNYGQGIYHKSMTCEISDSIIVNNTFNGLGVGISSNGTSLVVKHSTICNNFRDDIDNSISSFSKGGAAISVSGLCKLILFNSVIWRNKCNRYFIDDLPWYREQIWNGSNSTDINQLNLNILFSSCVISKNTLDNDQSLTKFFNCSTKWGCSFNSQDKSMILESSWSSINPEMINKGVASYLGHNYSKYDFNGNERVVMLHGGINIGAVNNI